jgi:hypothetical protein
MAADQGLTYGRDVIFTYGPLGFLTLTPFWFHAYGVLAFLYILVLRVATATAVFVAARRSLGTFLAAVIAVIAASLNGGARTEPAIMLIVAMWAVCEGVRGRRAVIIAGAFGAISGVQLLCKLSIGIDCALTTAVVIWSLPERRLLLAAISAGIGAGVFLTGWLVTGQALGALVDYCQMALQMVFGYGPAMSLDDATTSWAYMPALLMLGVGMWAALRTTRGLMHRQRIGACVVWLLFWFFAFKEGFLRQNSIEIGFFFALLLMGLFAFRWQRQERGFALAVAVGLVVLTLASWGTTITTAVNVTHNISAAVRDFRLVAGSGLSNSIASGRAKIQKADHLDPTALQLLRGRTVSTFPTEIATVWAYGLHWRPLPVLQSYAAFTPKLDHADAAFLASERAPDRVLLGRNSDIDTRVLAFDQGETTRALLCRYASLHIGSSFAVLGRTANRCSEPRLIATAQVAWGQRVPVPPPPTPNSMVLVKITGIQVAGLEKIRSFLWKAALRWVVLDGANHRLIEATAGDGLPLRASTGLDYPAPFSLLPQIHVIIVNKPGAPAGGRPLTYRFYAQSFAPA